MAYESEDPLLFVSAVESKDDIAKSPETKKIKIDSVHDGEPDADDRQPVEVEEVRQDEFEFLDGATRLAVLQAELDDVRNGLAKSRNKGKYVPLKLFRRWGNRVISVTDLTAGLWCEVQVEYRHLHPHMKSTGEWTKMEEKGTPVALKTEGMRKGSAVHLVKELEVHDIVRVENVTKEDRLAVQLINTHIQLAAIKAGGLEREISVFGDPFDLGIFVRGVIDQLQFSLESGELVLLDYKTRRSKTLPSIHQKKGNALQLMLYKCLLDSMTCGVTKTELLSKHLHLNRDAVLTSGPVGYIQQCGLYSAFTNNDSGGNSSNEEIPLTFGRVADIVLRLVVELDLPLVGSLVVQYEHQDSGEVLGVDSVEYDEAWMRRELEKNLEFWSGERPARGVDVEDAWKCQSCQFKDICVWNLKRKLESSPAARLPHQK